jgi:SPP1 family predicted phage head-tail adaptor
VILPPGTVAFLRTQAERSLTDECVIQTPTTSVGSYGNQTTTWSTVDTVACRVSPSALTPGERQQADQPQTWSTWTVLLPAETTVTDDDRITWNGQTFAVIAAQAPRTDEILRRVIVEERSG